MYLFNAPVFNNVSEKEIIEIKHLGYMRQCCFKRGSAIFNMGEQIDELGIILSGNVIIENIDLCGNKSILSFISQGQVFAETYALCHEKMMVNVIACEDCEILFLNLKFINNTAAVSHAWHNKIVNNLLTVTAHKNLLLSNRIFCTSPKTIRERLLTYLSYQSIIHESMSFTIPFNRQQLADYLNLDRSALSKELGRMRDDGLLSFKKNHFRLFTLPQMR